MAQLSEAEDLSGMFGAIEYIKASSTTEVVELTPDTDMDFDATSFAQRAVAAME